MPELLKLYKNLGETPLECILRFKDANPEYKSKKMTYLGRLDPLAEGLLLVLSGDTRGKDKYLLQDKTYEFDVLWGFSTDTYDVLGRVVSGSGEMPKKIEEKMQRLLDEIKNKKVQVYPPYSSRTVGGKPLFQWARENKMEEIDVPQKGIKIFDLSHQDTRLVSKADLSEQIKHKLNLVKGDFRQEEISGSWRHALENSREEHFLISSFTASVSSGTYIRGLVNEMGKFFEIGAATFWIKRTRVGDFSLPA
ncbi:MAG: tRNA pseudouridine55 synthase [Parcubacteria bacterium C7867-005]|nr:MAG: tRNA pseudouridine55 synthase [Parcubacteria bacterium C7867-005]